MIKLECENNLILETITNYLDYKNYFVGSQNERYQTIIKIYETDKSIKLDVNGNITDLALPLDINLLASEILKIIIDININFGNFKYFPYQRLVTNFKKKSLLSDIQNIIISNLLVSKEGMDKNFLYQSIWKRDKTISINKLDTHLTNLKNKLMLDLDLKINFQSQNKMLRLLIN